MDMQKKLDEIVAIKKQIEAHNRETDDINIVKDLSKKLDTMIKELGQESDKMKQQATVQAEANKNMMEELAQTQADIKEQRLAQAKAALASNR